jgi:hypothetical protein
MWKTSGHSLQVCTLRGAIAVLIGWQRTTTLPRRLAEKRHRPQLGVDGLDVTHAREPMDARRWQHFTRLGSGVRLAHTLV